MNLTMYSTEGFELLTPEILKENEDLKIVSFLGSVGTGTSWKLNTIAVLPKIEAYFSPSHFISRRLVKGEEIFPSVRNTNLHSFIKLVLSTLQEETLLTYPALELEKLEQLYNFRKRSEVIKFLEDNPFLIEFLYEAYQQIQIYFGLVQVILEVVTDPEIKGHQELGVFIYTGFPVDEALKRLEQLDKKWWLDSPTIIRSKVCIDVKFE